jgi:hypothetical protein
MFVLKTLGRLVLGNKENSQLLSIDNGTLVLKNKTKKPSAISLVRQEVTDKSKKTGPTPQYCIKVQGLSVVLGSNTSLIKKGSTFLVQQGKDTLIEWEAPADAMITTLEMFQVTVAQCLYEVKTGKAATQASDADIKNFIITQFDNKGMVGDVVFESDVAEFFIFDSSTNIFALKAKATKGIITRDSKTLAFLFIIKDVDGNVILHEQKIDPDGTIHTDRPSKSFIWCHFTDTGHVWTYSLRFGDAAPLMSLSNAFGQAIYEILNQEKISKEDSKYLLNPFGGGNEIEMAEAPPLSISSSESEDETADETEASEEETYRAGYSGAEKYSNLAIGYKNNRSFVARGSNIGIFQFTEDDRLVHSTDVKVKYQKETFSPNQMMLHQQDSSLLLMNPQDKHNIYKMDLERGEVVESWKVDENRDVTNILPSARYSQMTNESTLIGLNDNSIFRIDPRLSGTKRVEDQSKTYVVKNKFSCGATTGSGELAVGSQKGEIRLFNALDKRAKSLLPGFGDPILGIDATESGRWIVATCKTYLLLINTEMDGTDKNGFQTSMSSKGHPPIRLSLRPEHVAYIGAPLSFTPARFSTGGAEERSIITSSGPFVITWSLRRVQQGKLHDYAIKRYEDSVVADSFRYGQEQSIVVALPEYVTMVSKKSLAAPSPRSLRKH